MTYHSPFHRSLHSAICKLAGVALSLLAAQASFAQQADSAAIEEWVTASMCAADNRSVDLSAAPSFTYTAPDGNNPRHLSAEQAGLTTADLSNLELAWAIAFPQTSGMRAAPVIVGSTIFYSATDAGRVFALDIDSGCARWVYESGTRLRSSLAYGVVDGEPTLVFSDMPGMIHSIKAATGEVNWVASGQASTTRAC